MLTVTECRAAAAIKAEDGSFYYISSTGKILEQNASDGGLVVVTGLESAQTLTVGEEIEPKTDAAVSAYLAIMQVLTEQEMADELQFINLQELTDVRIGYGGRFDLRIGAVDSDLSYRVRFAQTVISDRLSPSDIGKLYWDDEGQDALRTRNGRGGRAFGQRFGCGGRDERRGAEPGRRKRPDRFAEEPCRPTPPRTTRTRSGHGQFERYHGQRRHLGLHGHPVGRQRRTTMTAATTTAAAMTRMTTAMTIRTTTRTIPTNRITANNVFVQKKSASAQKCVQTALVRRERRRGTRKTASFFSQVRYFLLQNRENRGRIITIGADCPRGAAGAVCLKAR